MIGKTISHYKILSELGKGGMGVVYKAQDLKLQRLVALKFLPSNSLGNEEAKARFLREARAAAALQHPNICTVYEIDEVDGQTFIAMAYLEGDELTKSIEKGPLSVERLLDIAIQVGRGLQEAHSKGVVHRDIKPANIMDTTSGQAVLMDFGLAQLASAASKLTREGTTVGTSAYMSPEQTTGEKLDHRTDIWALGVVLYEMATGQVPFQGHYEQAILYSILNEPPEPITAVRTGVPPELERIVNKCLAKRAGERYQTISDLLADLSALKRATESGEGQPPEPLEAQPQKPRRAFVGREEETTELGRLLESVRLGHGSLVLIGGEPGVGKTRLCEEILADAGEQQMLVLTGHSYEGEGVQSFIPFVESLEAASRTVPRTNFRAALGGAAPEIAKLMPELRRTFPDIPEPIQLPAEQQQRYLFNGFREFIERLSRQTPIVWLLDDLHWAEESSLLLLQHLAQGMDSLPVLVLGTYRDVELEVGKPFEKALSQLVRQRLARRITLRRLPQASVGDLLESLAGSRPPDSLVRVIYHETEGNPFFVEEVFEHLSEEGKLFDEEGRWKSDLKTGELEVPEGVRLVIGRRLERLSPQSPKILSAAAIIGRVFELETLESLEGLDPDDVLDAIEEAESARLIVTVSTGREVSYRFTHELIRHTLLVGLSIRRRQRTHLLIADVLEMKGAENVSSIAHHLFQAGAAADLDKTVRYLKLAGELELETGAFQEALEHFDTGLSLLEDESPETRAGLLVLKGRAAQTQGKTEESLAAWNDAATLYESFGDTKGMARTCVDILNQASWRADFDSAILILSRGLTMTEHDVTPERCRLLATAGACLAASGDCETAPSLLRQSVTMAEKLGDPLALGEVLHSGLYSHWLFMTSDQWLDDAERAVELLRSAGNLWGWVDAAGLLQVARVFTGNLEEAVQPGEAEEVGRQLGHRNVEAFFKIGREFGGFLRSGKIDELENYAEWYRDWCREMDYPWELVAESHLGLCRFWRGEWEGFHEHFQRGVDIEEAQPSGWYAWGNYFMAMAYAGDQRALALLEKKRATLPHARPFNTCGAWIALMRVIEGLAVMGRREEAAELYPLAKLSIETGTLVDFFSTAMPQLAAGISAACARNWAAAEGHYQTALEQAHEMPHRMAQADIRRWYAQMLLDRDESGDRDKAAELLTEAMARYRELGMPKHLAMTESLHAPLAREAN